MISQERSDVQTTRRGYRALQQFVGRRLEEVFSKRHGDPHVEPNLALTRIGQHKDWIEKRKHGTYESWRFATRSVRSQVDLKQLPPCDWRRWWRGDRCSLVESRDQLESCQQELSAILRRKSSFCFDLESVRGSGPDRTHRLPDDPYLPIAGVRLLCVGSQRGKVDACMSSIPNAVSTNRWASSDSPFRAPID